MVESSPHCMKSSPHGSFTCANNAAASTVPEADEVTVVPEVTPGPVVPEALVVVVALLPQDTAAKVTRARTATSDMITGNLVFFSI